MKLFTISLIHRKRYLSLVTRAPSDTLSMVIQNGAKKWGGMYTIDEFAYAPFEALEEKGRTAKPIELEVGAKTTSKQKA